MKTGKLLEIIILAIIAIGIISLLIWGFSTNWGKKVNAYEVKESCEEACFNKNYEDFCVKERAVWFNDGSGVSDITCSGLVMGGRLNLDWSCRTELCE